MKNPVALFIERRLKNQERKNRTAAELISWYYLDKYAIESRDLQYKNAQEEVRALGLTQISVKGNELCITLSRPGILIGRKGENIDKFERYMNDKGGFTKIKIVEDRVIGCSIPYDYSDIDEFM
jgi:ribosomal protein S3